MLQKNHFVLFALLSAFIFLSSCQSGQQNLSPFSPTASDSGASDTAPQNPPPPGVPAHVAILKLDDLVFYSSYLSRPVNTNWYWLSDYIRSEGIRASIGIICQSMETNATNVTTYYTWIKTRAVENGGNFEFWHHGYDHFIGVGQAEFLGTTAAFQQTHFDKGVSLMSQKLGLICKSFGAPGNASDATFAGIFNAQSQVDVWMYGNSNQAASSKRVLVPFQFLETNTGMPSYVTFTNKYRTLGSANKPYLLLQAHPGRYSTDLLRNEFSQIVTFLKNSGWVFMTPREYADLRWPKI